MEHVDRVLARPKRVGEQRIEILRRKLPLELYELEPESGEEEDLEVDVDLDELED